MRRGLGGRRRRRRPRKKKRRRTRRRRSARRCWPSSSFRLRLLQLLLLLLFLLRPPLQPRHEQLQLGEEDREAEVLDLVDVRGRVRGTRRRKGRVSLRRRSVDDVHRCHRLAFEQKRRFFFTFASVFFRAQVEIMKCGSSVHEERGQSGQIESVSTKQEE